MMKKIMWILLVIVLVLGCKSSTEPENLNYVTILRYEGEVVGGFVVYYVDYRSGGYEWSKYKPVGTVWNHYPLRIPDWGGHTVVAGKDFEWQERQWRCKTVTEDYIEIALKE
jgi:hypothetical protein